MNSITFCVYSYGIREDFFFSIIVWLLSRCGDEMSNFLWTSANDREFLTTVKNLWWFTIEKLMVVDDGLASCICLLPSQDRINCIRMFGWLVAFESEGKIIFFCCYFTCFARDGFFVNNVTISLLIAPLVAIIVKTLLAIQICDTYFARHCYLTNEILRQSFLRMGLVAFVIYLKLLCWQTRLVYM